LWALLLLVLRGRDEGRVGAGVVEVGSGRCVAVLIELKGGSGIGWVARSMWVVSGSRFGACKVGSVLGERPEERWVEVIWLGCCLGMVCWRIIRDGCWRCIN
jgi:hypothetical protein